MTSIDNRQTHDSHIDWHYLQPSNLGYWNVDRFSLFPALPVELEMLVLSLVISHCKHRAPSRISVRFTSSGMPKCSGQSINQSRRVSGLFQGCVVSPQWPAINQHQR